MILTLILIASCILGGSGATLGYQKLTKVNRSKRAIERLVAAKEVLPDTIWVPFLQYVKNVGGYFYADGLVKEIIEQGYYFDCSQIYQLRDAYKNLIQGNFDVMAHVNALTHYEAVLKRDAKDKVFELIAASPEQLLLEGQESYPIDTSTFKSS